MPYFAMLLAIHISLVTNSKINYGSLFMLVMILLTIIAIGGHLGLSGGALLKSTSIWRRMGGLLLLAAASICVGGPLWLGYWEFTQLIDLV